MTELYGAIFHRISHMVLLCRWHVEPDEKGSSCQRPCMHACTDALSPIQKTLRLNHCQVATSPPLLLLLPTLMVLPSTILDSMLRCSMTYIPKPSDLTYVDKHISAKIRIQAIII